MDSKDLNGEMILYRLDSIEKAIVEVKEDQKIYGLQKYQIEELSTKVTAQQIEIAGHDVKIRDLQSAPDKAKAKRWQEVIDVAYKSIIELAIIGLLIKIGLK